MRDEYDVYDIWKTWADQAGLRSVKLENAAASSVPDMMLAMKGIILLHELKVLRSGSFTMPIFQWGFMLQFRHALHPWQLSYIVYDELTENEFKFDVYSVDQVKAQNPQAAGGQGKRLKVNMLGAVPMFTITDKVEFGLYREWILDNAFKRKKVAVNAV